jgi:hypothetical protein
MQLEHATIPPYLTALYSIHPGTNSDAYHILRVVVVEEMLHLTLAANLLNAIGGKPNLTVPGFVPEYATPLPDGETDFEVSLEPFSEEAICTFLKIERPAQAPDESSRRVAKRVSCAQLGSCHDDENMVFYSIGELYEDIARRFTDLCEQIGPDELFCGDPARQVTPEYYYSGGGELFAVKCTKSAQKAIDLITGQGEGFGGGIYNADRELAHYYRFDQLNRGCYYQAGDKPDEPTGPELHVDYKSVYPTKKNPRVSDYAESPELRDAAVAFNKSYADFLASLTLAYNGNPGILMQAVPQMFHLRDKIMQLMHNPLPGVEGQNAAPTFEMGKTQA